MKEISEVTIQQVREAIDLSLLARGDVVDMIYQNEPSSKYSLEEFFVAFHRQTADNWLEFLTPALLCGEDYILMFRAPLDQIQNRDGKVVLNEDRSVTRSYSRDKDEYADLQRTSDKSRLLELEWSSARSHR